MTESLALWVHWLPQLLGGFIISLQVTFASLALGIPLGLALAVVVSAKSRVLSSIGLLVVEAGRGAPVLVLLQFFYFGLPSAEITLSSFGASVAALAWSTGAYTSEFFRAGLNSVPFGQHEAAHVLGLNKRDAFRLIVLPQALRVSIPPLLGFSILVLQATSLCFTVALPELVGIANEIGSNTFRYMSVMILTGLIYASVCVPATIFVSRFEKRLGGYESN